MAREKIRKGDSESNYGRLRVFYFGIISQNIKFRVWIEDLITGVYDGEIRHLRNSSVPRIEITMRIQVDLSDYFIHDCDFSFFSFSFPFHDPSAFSRLPTLSEFDIYFTGFEPAGSMVGGYFDPLSYT